MTPETLVSMPFLTIGVGSALAILAGALALGIRHGIDWDHIAAITDITSAAAVAPTGERALADEPAVVFRSAGSTWELEGAAVGAAHGLGPGGAPRLTTRSAATERLAGYARRHRAPLFLGTMYALGHGSMVVALGLMAILFKEILPDWIDPIMERVVGDTLLLLAAYLSYSVFRYFRGGEFRIRSRWMLVFAGVAHCWRWATHRVLGPAHAPAHEHVADQQYGAGTAYGIGLLHGVGA